MKKLSDYFSPEEILGHFIGEPLTAEAREKMIADLAEMKKNLKGLPPSAFKQRTMTITIIDDKTDSSTWDEAKKKDLEVWVAKTRIRTLPSYTFTISPPQFGGYGIGYGQTSWGTTTLPVVPAVPANNPTTIPATGHTGINAAVNWCQPDNLAYPYSVGDEVWTYYDGEPARKFRVLARRESSARNEGGYQVKVGAIDIGPRSVVEGVYIGACYFFPMSCKPGAVEAKRRDPNFPHDCTFCGSPAYIGATSNDCSAKCDGLKPEFRKK